MPELPEVETVRRGIEPHIIDMRIKTLTLSSKKLRLPFPANMASKLQGQTIKSIARRGKYLLLHLSTAQNLIMHLGMSGRIQILHNTLINFHYNQSLNPKHNHVIFVFINGKTMVFNDPRRFGMVDLVADNDLWERPYLKHLGAEPLSNNFTAPYLKTCFKNKTASIKSALLDQRIIAGIGNIYANEALFDAYINPLCPAGMLDDMRIENLVYCIRKTLKAAIDAGGSSLRDHRQADGTLGYFQHHFKIYGRAEKVCLNTDCNEKICKIQQNGQSSFYCPQCQKL